MRRFSRRRRGSSGDGAPAIDAARWLSKINENGIEAAPLQALSDDEVPEDLAALGEGEREDGTKVVLGFSPADAGDALFAALAMGQRLSEQEGGFSGEVLAIAPEWSIAARRRLGLIKAELPFRLRTLAPASLAESGDAIEAESALDPSVVPVAQVVAQVAEAGLRDVFARTTAALEGLAAKHGGSIRGVGDSVELVLLARRVARLRVEDRNVVLDTLAPQRSSARLSDGELGAALDGLEGQLRRRLNDRRVRDAEEGMRTRVVPLLVTACHLRDPQRWPQGGSDRDEIDVIGLDESGRPVIGMVRKELSIKALGPMLDAVQRMRLALPGLFAASMPPVLLQTPRVVIAAEAYTVGALRVLSALSVAHELFELRPGHDRGYELASIESAEAARSLAEKAPRPRRRGGRGRPRPGDDEGKSSEAPEVEAAEEVVEAEAAAPARGRGGRKRGGRRRGRERSDEVAEADKTDSPSGEAPAESARPEKSSSGFEEVSLFDLDDGSDGDGDGDDDDRSRRRRGRGRRRGKRDAEDENGKPGSEERPERGRGRGRGAAAAAKAEPADEDADDEDVVEDDLDTLAELPDELEDEPKKKRFGGSGSDDEDEDEDESLSEEAVEEPVEPAPVVEVVEEKKQPRRRAAVVALGDRDSVFAAILLCRDIRLLEGLWVYPQSELMNFFREVATDLRDDCPIYLVGFTPSPAMDVLQAASLYSDRIVWFDHHEWPPEDHAAVRDLLGEESLNHAPGVGSSMPLILETCTRRSRFSDKLVDLAAGRFTPHDFERWGRVWWANVGEIAKKSGDAKGDIGPLLAGRPSDLAKEAARLEAPPIPPEVEYAASRDFRLVYFAGYALAIVDIEGDHDPQMTARVVRERYEAPLSLAYRQGTDLFMLAGDELAGRRAFELGGLTEHLSQKLDWVEALPDNDRIARFHIRDLEANPERLTEVISEIAMGRSILEG